MIYNFAGSDPGSTNYGYSIINVDIKRGFHVSIHEIGMLTCQINNLTNKEAKPPKSKRRKVMIVPNYKPFPVQLRIFKKHWNHVLNDFDVRRATMERFQPRGGGGLMGLATESVNIMNGIICLLANEQNRIYELVTAASWKNQVNRYINLEATYKEVKLKDHSVDSFFIAVHGALKYFDLTWADVDFEQLLEELKTFEF